jgi:hypothetical protein
MIPMQSESGISNFLLTAAMKEPNLMWWWQPKTWQSTFMFNSFWNYIKIINCFIVGTSFLFLYRVSQEECARLREGVPYGKVYWYNPKHQSWTVTEIIAREKCGLLAGPYTVPISWQVSSMFVLECGVRWRLTLAVSCICASFRVRCGRIVNGLECAVSHVTWVLNSHVSCIVIGTLRTTMICASFFVVQFNGFMSLTS